MPSRLVRHFHWPRGWHPMRRDAGDPPPFGDVDGPYQFRTVEGPGVYEIPVGPVHAGMIEPGSLPVLRRRRDHPEPQGPAVVRAPRHRETLRGPHPRRRDRTGRTGQRGHLRRPRPGVLPGRRGRLRCADLPCHPTDPGDPAGAGAAVQPRQRHRRAVQRRRPRHPEQPGAAGPRTAAADQRPGHRAPAAPRRDPDRRGRGHRAARPGRAGRHRRRRRRDRRPRPGAQRGPGPVHRHRGADPPAGPRPRHPRLRRPGQRRAGRRPPRPPRARGELPPPHACAHRRGRAVPVPDPRRGDRRVRADDHHPDAGLRPGIAHPMPRRRSPRRSMPPPGSGSSRAGAAPSCTGSNWTPPGC